MSKSRCAETRSAGLNLERLESRILLSGATEVAAFTDGTATVTVYDAEGDMDVDAADVAVLFGDAGQVKAITLGGEQAMEGVGIVISGATSVGKISDRRALRGDVAFIASNASINKIGLKSGMSGYNLNNQTLGGLTFAGDIDGDGDTEDTTALYTEGGLKTVKLYGQLDGDVWLGGTYPGKSYSLSKLDNKSGGFHGDLVAAARVGTVKLTGTFGSSMSIDGALSNLTIKYGDLDGDVAVAEKLSKVYVKYGDLNGDLDVGGTLKKVSVKNGDLTGDIEVGGYFDSLSVKNGSVSAETEIDVEGWNSTLFSIKKISVANGDFLGEVSVPTKISSVKIRGGDYGGQIETGFCVLKFEVRGKGGVGGTFLADANLDVGGILFKFRVDDHENTSAFAETFGVEALMMGDIRLGGLSMGNTDMPYVDNDFQMDSEMEGEVFPTLGEVFDLSDFDFGDIGDFGDFFDFGDWF